MPSYFDEGADDSDPYEDRKEPSPKEPAPYEATTSQEFSGRAPAVADERQSGQTATVEPPGPPSSGGPVIEQGGFAYSGDRFKQDLLTAQARQVYDALPQQAKVHYALSQLELSRSEAMQAQRLQNTIGAVEAHPGLTRGQKDDLIFQARTKLNPMLIRQANANLLKTQSQTEQVMDTIAKNAAMERRNIAFHKMADADRVSDLPGGKLVQVSPGKYAWHPDKPEQGTGDEANHVVEDKKAYSTLFKEHSRLIDARIKAFDDATDKTKAPRDSIDVQWAKDHGDANPRLTAIQKSIAAELGGKHTGSRESYLQEEAAARTGKPIPKSDAAGEVAPKTDKEVIEKKIEDKKAAAVKQRQYEIAEAQHSDRIQSLTTAGDRAFNKMDMPAKEAAYRLRETLTTLHNRRRTPTPAQEAAIKADYALVQKYIKE